MPTASERSQGRAWTGSACYAPAVRKRSHLLRAAALLLPFLLTSCSSMVEILFDALEQEIDEAIEPEQSSGQVAGRRGPGTYAHPCRR